MMRAALLLALLLGLQACGGESGAPEAHPLPPVDERGPLLAAGPLSDRIADYRIEAELDPEAHRIEAHEALTWTNASQTPVDRLPFHLYMNAFKNEETLFMKESGGRRRGQRASERHWGWIEVSSIEIRGRQVRDRARYPGPDETVLEVPLERPVEPGQSVRVDLAFSVKLPRAFARTGYAGRFHMVGQWFPKIGVLSGAPGEERWQCEPFHADSEFFADFGTYDVSITVPDSYVVAATGVLVAARERKGGGRRTLRYRAEDVHDFSWAADPYLESVAGPAHTERGSVEVRVYYRPRQRRFALRHLEAGIKAIELFSRDYLPYPWTRMTIVDPPPEAAGAVGGMEYQTLVTTGGDSFFFPRGIRVPEEVTIHEVGHNWFQGMLATNEVEEAWLDEGLNEYADGLVMAELYGKRASLVDWGRYYAGYFDLHRALPGRLSDIPDRIARPSYRFADTASYQDATYLKTALALRTLENLVGGDRFRAALKSYARRYAFHHPSGEDFFAALERALGRDLDWYVQPAFYQRGVADLRVRDVECHRKHRPRGVFGTGNSRRQETGDDDEQPAPFRCRVLVVNLGRVRVPVDVEIHFADGTKVTRQWSDLGPWHRFEIERTSPIEEVILDPDHEVAIDDGGLKSSYRVEPERGSSRRTAARAQFWTQSLMQMTGL